MNPIRPIIASLFIFAGIQAYGQIWSEVTVPGVSWWGPIAISADGSKLIAFAGASGTAGIYISTNSGSTWVSNNFAPSSVASVACSPDGTAFALVDGNQAWLSTNSGSTWNDLNYISKYVLITPDGKKLIILNSFPNQELLASTNWGVTWSDAPLPSAPHAVTGPLAVSGDGTTIVSAGTHGIYISTNSGQSWVESMVAGDGSWNSVTCSADGSRMAAAANPGDQGIFLSTNGGAIWTETDNGSAVAWQIASSVNGRRLIASPASYSVAPGLYVSSDSGFTWTAVMSGNYGSLACSQDGTRLVAVTNGMNLTKNGAIFVGFWPPSLTIGVANGNIVLSWPAPSAGFVLEQNTEPASTNWTPVSSTPFVTNYQNQVIIPSSNRTVFYRLRETL
jgi:hypothetical protein